MENPRLKGPLIISIVLHLCFVSLVSNFHLNPIEDSDFRIVLTPFPYQENPSKPLKTQKPLEKPKELSVASRSDMTPEKSIKDKKNTSPPPFKKERTIELNTLPTKDNSYPNMIKRKIESAWYYPHEAREKEIQGKLTMKFSILYDGSLTELQLLQSSGFLALDEGALKSVLNAAPFSPIPKKMGIEKLNIIVTFEYRIDYLL
ncbi:MAG: energy transducer TonB [Thermodesulfobacteriota bacterium]|nr:energy transducer TonB [Thermodesulfobacteriota bacterium]